MKKILLFILPLLFIIACEDEQDDLSPLTGNWEMTDFVARLATPVQPEPGDITWKIDVENNQLIILNNIHAMHPITFPSDTHVLDVGAINQIMTFDSTQYDYWFSQGDLWVKKHYDFIVADIPERKFKPLQ